MLLGVIDKLPSVAVSFPGHFLYSLCRVTDEAEGPCVDRRVNFRTS